MRPQAAPWPRILTGASVRVKSVVDEVARAGSRGKVVGIGASGDKTLLADKKAEEELMKALDRVDGIRILSEEAGESGDPDSSVVAVIDPLDGSANFEREIPFYCTSVAVVEGGLLNGVFFGMIRNLVNGDLYLARRGEGTTKNGKRLHGRRMISLSDSVVDIDISRGAPPLLERLGPLVSSVRRQVHYGANALELCMLADGRIDAFVDIRGKMRVTDFAASYLIAKEVGAIVTDDKGGELNPRISLDEKFSFVAAANRDLHRQILELIQAGA
jgi:myo-inositol-1(or 4)-monophosphatase